MEENKSKVKITKQNIDELYIKVNELIDNYFTWKIRPSSLKKYLKAGSIGLNKFIQLNKLDVYENIQKIIDDVISDRYSLELDGVKKFENFETDSPESKTELEKSDVNKVLYTNIKESDIKYEKILADLYRVSLSSVIEEDLKKHIYNVEDRNTSMVLIFSKEDMDIIRKNLVDYSYEYINTIDLRMESLFLKFSLKDKIDESKFKNKLTEESKDMKIEEWISDVVSVEEFEFKKEYKGYFIWEK